MFLLSLKFKWRYLFIALGTVVLIIGSVLIYSNLKPPADAAQFLKSYGMDADLLEQKPMYIPKEFPPFLTQYNNTLKKQGFDLTDYKGKKCTRLRYKIKNYESDTVADVFMFNGKIIGGDYHRQFYSESPMPFNSFTPK